MTYVKLENNKDVLSDEYISHLYTFLVHMIFKQVTKYLEEDRKYCLWGSKFDYV